MRIIWRGDRGRAVRVLAVVVGVALFATGCPSRASAIAGGLSGGVLITVGAVAKEQSWNEAPKRFGPSFSETLVATGILIVLISLVSLPFTSDDDGEPPPPPPPSSPIVAGDARPIEQGMAGVRDVVTRCGRALGITGVIRLQVKVSSGRVTAHPEHPREGLAGCILTEIAAVSFPRSTTMDVAISFLIGDSDGPRPPSPQISDDEVARIERTMKHAARSGDCALVRAQSMRIAALDLVAHRNLFTTDAFVAACIDGSSTELPTALTAVMFQQGLFALRTVANACAGDVAATWRARVRVSSDGEVTEVRFEEDVHEALSTCVRAALRNARFRKTRDGGAFSIAYPF